MDDKDYTPEPEADTEERETVANDPTFLEDLTKLEWLLEKLPFRVATRGRTPEQKNPSPMPKEKTPEGWRQITAVLSRIEEGLSRMQLTSSSAVKDATGPVEKGHRRVEDQLRTLDQTLRQFERTFQKEIRKTADPVQDSQRRLENALRDLEAKRKDQPRQSLQLIL